MSETPITASRFETECLGLLAQVSETGASYTIIEHGKPIARLVPLDDADPASLDDSVTIHASDEDEFLTTGERWQANS